MTSRPQSVIWPAEAHTLAKIEILSAYLVAWFQILGIGKQGKNIFYVDGFAGPGKYEDNLDGSPLVALEALRKAKINSSTRWRAGIVHCVFVERDKERFRHGGSKFLTQQFSKSLGRCIPKKSFARTFV